MWLAARRFNRITETSIALRFDNAGLIQELRSEIGERERAEARLLQNQKRIEFIVEERTAALRDTNAQLVQEIKGREKSEEALRVSEEKYRDLVENINDLIYAIDKDGIVTYVSPTIEQILGYQPEDIIGQAFVAIIHPEDLCRVKRQFGRVLSGKLEPQAYRVRKKDGSHCWVEVSSRPVYRNDMPVGVQGVLTDITEKKHLEAKLNQAHKMEAIGTLAGGVAHDLNNILSGLVSYPQLVLMELPEDSPIRSSILVIQESGEKAAAIVQDLLTLARRGVSTTKVVNLNNIIEEYLKSPEHNHLVSHYPHIDFTVDLDPGLLNLSGSRVHLSKSIMNLVLNAAEAVGERGRVEITTENRYIDMGMTALPRLTEGDYILLSVKDNGNGIHPDDINKIFEPFYTKKAMGRSGTGLGMAVIWGTVQDHHGVIDVESTPGEGTTFYLYFPATRQAVAERISDHADAVTEGLGETVLVVDDVAEQRNIAGSMLSKLGYAVTTAASGEEAIDCLKAQNYDLLVLDMIMEGGMDGLETYRQAIRIRSGQRAIIVSGFSETDRVREAQTLGAGSYLKKPYLMNHLGRAVRLELDRRLVRNIGENPGVREAE